MKGFCIYCGGNQLATTIDHNPAAIIFDGKQRPKGLEFPSCYPCNHGTKHSELVAAAIGRAYPDVQGEAAIGELKGLYQAIVNNVPGLLEELQVRAAAAKFAAKRLRHSEGGYLNFSGPILSAHLDVFGAKLAFALHYKATGKAVPKGGGVISRLHTNVNLLEDEAPNGVVEHLGQPSTLRQGAKHVSDQFLYGCSATPNGSMSMAFASFRQTFAISMFAAEEIDNLKVGGEFLGRPFAPGDLQAPVPPFFFQRISAEFKA